MSWPLFSMAPFKNDFYSRVTRGETPEAFYNRVVGGDWLTNPRGWALDFGKKKTSTSSVPKAPPVKTPVTPHRINLGSAPSQSGTGNSPSTPPSATKAGGPPPAATQGGTTVGPPPPATVVPHSSSPVDSSDPNSSSSVTPPTTSSLGGFGGAGGGDLGDVADVTASDISGGGFQDFASMSLPPLPALPPLPMLPSTSSPGIVPPLKKAGDDKNKNASKPPTSKLLGLATFVGGGFLLFKKMGII